MASKVMASGIALRTFSSPRAAAFICERGWRWLMSTAQTVAAGDRRANVMATGPQPQPRLEQCALAAAVARPPARPGCQGRRRRPRTRPRSVRSSSVMSGKVRVTVRGREATPGWLALALAHERERYATSGLYTGWLAPCYSIRLFGDPVLWERASEITDVDGAVKRLADDMLDTLRVASGLAGGAAGRCAEATFVYEFPDTDDGPKVLVNPVITETRGEWEYEEGCLLHPRLVLPDRSAQGSASHGLRPGRE